MCSSIFVSSTSSTISSSKTMDNYQGDLTDIIRAPGTTTATATTTAGAYSTTGTSSSSSEYVLQHLHDNQWHHHNHNHQLFSSSDHLHRQHHHQHQHQHQQQQQNMSFINSVLEGTNMNNMFGDPLLSTLRDPFLQELDHIPSSSYFNITTNTTTTTAATTTTASPASTSIINVSDVSNSIFALDHNHNHEIRSNSRPCKNIFSNMIQISPNPKLPSNYESSSTMAPSPRQIKQVVSTNININANISKDSLLDNTGVQISSSRNSSGLKRRKNQAKKVVCIPAPAAANSRQTGEVVPSDLWAWRKYGQKPIKGSPYPRGYYRCSSSKGCSARKQVERSRTDPNMLVITYTSEHNHPWPTQRNALAGSTRSQPSKTNMKNSEASLTQNDTSKPKEENQENNNSDENDSPIVNNVKEENMEDIEKLQIEMDEVEGEFNDGLSYKSSMIENNQSHEDFFAELGEIEADPLNLLFNQGFSGNSSTNDVHQRDQSKGLDPFHLFDWSVDNNNTNK
ncbi:probable WRKY transcription factor 35 [Trifolium pratense]|uniref:probable WRKY transcription factor 35 n=1 Tax=Trifolium pratense TaxID=57577 RepID=UPI001E692350|nr:probable WRKY transcription factor 35 [Trifolium pratense]